MASTPQGRPSRKVKLADDKEYVLVYDLNALADLEEATGKTIAQLGEMMQKAEGTGGTAGIGLKESRALLWAGLQHHHSRITVRRAGDLLGDLVQMRPIMQAVGEALAAAFPGAEEAAAKTGGGAKGGANAQDSPGTPT